MSYDLFLYKSNTGKPDIDEATNVIVDDNDIWAPKPYNYKTKSEIEKALLRVDASLNGFDYLQLAQKQGKTVDEVKQSFTTFELSSGDGTDIQLSIYGYHVAITIPFSRQGEEAKKFFKSFSSTSKR